MQLGLVLLLSIDMTRNLLVTEVHRRKFRHRKLCWLHPRAEKL